MARAKTKQSLTRRYGVTISIPCCSAAAAFIGSHPQVPTRVDSRVLCIRICTEVYLGPYLCFLIGTSLILYICYTTCYINICPDVVPLAPPQVKWLSQLAISCSIFSFHVLTDCNEMLNILL